MYKHFFHSLAALMVWASVLLGSTASAATPTVVVGEDHSCALQSNGIVQCWGSAAFGDVSKGTLRYSSTPVPVPGITSATALSAGANHTCAVLSNGAVQCWGENNRYQLGYAYSSSWQSTPVTVKGITTAIGIAAGSNHTCALLRNGTVQCWGFNVFGELGNGKNLEYSKTPVAVIGIDNATAVAAGKYHSCALLSTGEVRCWGYNYFGDLGNGGNANSSVPVPVIGVGNATALTARSLSTCAVLSDGTIKCWGRGIGVYGARPNDSATPVTARGISNATNVAVGGIGDIQEWAEWTSQYACALLGGGAIQCWGANSLGQLGDGSFISSEIPVTVKGISDATAIAAGVDHTCAALHSGAVQCWGYGWVGKLGDGRDKSGFVPSPVRVLGTNGQGFLNLNVSSMSTDADKVFAWAEKSFPAYFAPGGQTSQSSAGYRLRFYPATNSYLGVNESGTPSLYYLGPLTNSAVRDLGLLSDWVALAER